MISVTISAKTGETRVNGRAVAAGDVVAATRALMTCTRRQARLALGEAACAVLDAASDDPALPFAMRDQLKSAHEWHRTAPEIDELAWLLGLGPENIDALFFRAMSL